MGHYWQNFIPFLSDTSLARLPHPASHCYILCAHIPVQSTVVLAPWAHLSLWQQKESCPWGGCCMQAVFNITAWISQKAYAISTITPILGET